MSFICKIFNLIDVRFITWSHGDPIIKLTIFPKHKMISFLCANYSRLFHLNEFLFLQDHENVQNLLLYLGTDLCNTPPGFLYRVDIDETENISIILEDTEIRHFAEKMRALGAFSSLRGEARDEGTATREVSHFETSQDPIYPRSDAPPEVSLYPFEICEPRCEPNCEPARNTPDANGERRDVEIIQYSRDFFPESIPANVFVDMPLEKFNMIFTIEEKQARIDACSREDAETLLGLME